jgi:hypothetical protein
MVHDVTLWINGTLLKELDKGGRLAQVIDSRCCAIGSESEAVTMVDRVFFIVDTVLVLGRIRVAISSSIRISRLHDLVATVVRGRPGRSYDDVTRRVEDCCDWTALIGARHPYGENGTDEHAAQALQLAQGCHTDVGAVALVDDDTSSVDEEMSV